MTLPSVYKIDKPEEKVSFEELAELGVFHSTLDPTKYEDDPELEKICKERGYTFRDFVNSEKIPNLEEKLDHFKTEHLHDDDEIRYFLKGSGYFDVKNKGDEWVRIHCGAGDFVVLPKGIWHRFVPDDKLYFFVMRLFQGDPVWTPHNRGDKGVQDRKARVDYVNAFRKGYDNTTRPKAYLEEDPEQEVSFAELYELGVFHKRFNPDIYENDPELEKFCKENNYTFRDFVNSEKIPNLEEKLDHFKIEHLHDDDEIRYFLKGSGYFDVKNKDDKFIRIHCGPGDFVNLPRGIYHRFIPDEKMNFFVMRLFCGDPVWTPHNRSDGVDDREARVAYVQKFGQGNKKQKV